MILLTEYHRAWRVLGRSVLVAVALKLEPDEHFELAAWGAPGAARVVGWRGNREEQKR